MKLKFYLRGLGIGILLTTLVFFVTKPKQELTEDEIISRAAELGMTMEQDSLSSLDEILQKSDQKDSQNSNSEDISSEHNNSEDNNSEDNNSTGENQTSSNGNESNDTESSDLEDGTRDSIKADIAQPLVMEEVEKELPEPHIFTITEGLSSGTVSKRLQEEGIVESSKAFNEYMISEGKVKSIRVGTYEIPQNASHEEIAKIITKKR